MILLKTTTEIDQKMLDEGRVQIIVDLGHEDVLVTVRREECGPYNAPMFDAGHVSRYQIALAMLAAAEQDNA